MIKKFFVFKEAKLSDVFISDDEILKKYQNKNFERDEELVQHVILDKYDYKIIHIEWNNYSGHDIINDKIKKRTNFESVSEFNEYFTNIINDLFNNHFDEIIKESKKYNIYLINKNISFVTVVDYDNLFENDTTITIKTIVNGLDSDFDDIIKIED